MSLNLVILHGWDQKSSDWEVIKEMLEKDCLVIIFDLPGFGDEPLENKNWDVPDYADWVISKIKNIEGDKVILGHSFGGRITSYIASSRPEWLKGIILYGAPCIYRPNLKVKMMIFFAKIFKILGPGKFFSVNNKELKRADVNSLGKVFRKTVSFDQTKILPSINIPTLLICGEYDLDVPVRIAKEMQTLIPKSKLQIIDQVGHNLHQENSYLFYGIIKNFLKTF